MKWLLNIRKRSHTQVEVEADSVKEAKAKVLEMNAEAIAKGIDVKVTKVRRIPDEQQ